jgi:hypothetical protein
MWVCKDITFPLLIMDYELWMGRCKVHKGLARSGYSSFKELLLNLPLKKHR